MAYLPAVWGSNAEKMSEPLKEISVDYQIEATESGFKIVFDKPLDGEEVAMLGLSGLQAERMTMTIPSSIALEGEAQFEFAGKGKEYLIPVCCSPYVTEEQEIDYLEFEVEAESGVATEEIDIHYYIW